MQPFQDGLEERPAPVILAGLHYDTPWTRDAAINAWNGASLIMPDVSRNTLLSVLTRADGKVRIGGQYWDAIVWTTGAWNHYLHTGDRQFLATALEATKNSLAYFEQTEFDGATNLFRGPGWSDGVAGYPDEYADAGGSSSILDWPKHNPDKVSKPGYGIPMQALSTNCLYYNAYLTADQMASELQVPADPRWATKAARLKEAINAHLWLPDKGYYRFLVGPMGNCEHQEGLGAAYALLFGVADSGQAESSVRPPARHAGWLSLCVAQLQPVRKTGWAGVWQARWNRVAADPGLLAEAAARAGKADIFAHELFNLAATPTRQAVCRDLSSAVGRDLWRPAREHRPGHHTLAGHVPETWERRPTCGWSDWDLPACNSTRRASASSPAFRTVWPMWNYATSTTVGCVWISPFAAEAPWCRKSPSTARDSTLDSWPQIAKDGKRLRSE